MAIFKPIPFFINNSASPFYFLFRSVNHTNIKIPIPCLNSDEFRMRNRDLTCIGITLHRFIYALLMHVLKNTKTHFSNRYSILTNKTYNRYEYSKLKNRIKDWLHTLLYLLSFLYDFFSDLISVFISIRQVLLKI